MTLAEATSSFLHYAGNEATVLARIQPAATNRALSFLISCFSPDASLGEVTASKLRDSLSRLYVESASVGEPRNWESLESDSSSTADGTCGDINANRTGPAPEPLDLLDSLEEFFKWTERQTGTGQAAEISKMLIELRQSLPRALAITTTLSRTLRERGGAFHFPEFLTSFEEGGGSQYDIDAPGNVGAIDGYFRIIRVEHSWVEAEEMISEQLLWPIVFPLEVASMLDCGYIVGLELIRDAEGWQIAGCGFAYPPGTEV
jgi:hypothetical protein